VNSRAADLVDLLGLLPHPEGGWYREVYRSTDVVTRDGQDRCALTTIDYLLTAGQVSRWHVVELDEVWHFHEGDPLALHLYDPTRGVVEVVELGPTSAEGARPQHVVPRGVWQAARPRGAFALVGCTVAPGFDFADFRMVDELPEADEAFDGPLAEHEDLR